MPIGALSSHMVDLRNDLSLWLEGMDRLRSELYSKLFEAFAQFWVLSKSTSPYYLALAVSGILPEVVQIDAVNLAP